MANASVIGSSVAGTPPQSPTAGPSTTLKQAHVFEVVSQIPLSKKGTYLTAKLSPLNRRRLISVEVHRILPSFEDDADAQAGSKSVTQTTNTFVKEAETCYVRILQPVRTFDTLMGKGTKHSAKKAVLVTDTEEKDDDSEAGTHGPEGFLDPSVDGESERFNGWVAKYRLPIRMVEIVEHNKRAIEIKGESKGHMYQREYIFESEPAASDFLAIIDHNKKLQEKRTKDRLEYMLSGITLQKDEQLTFLIDICSAMDLPRTDVGRDSDPYVTVRFDGRKVHRTHYISNEDNPIWTLRSKSLFIWKIDALELFQSEDGLIFEVKDYDAVGENESMGAFSVSPQTLYKWNGERKTFLLKPLLGKKDYGQVSSHQAWYTFYDH
jgi:hypothetical protein